MTVKRGVLLFVVSAAFAASAAPTLTLSSSSLQSDFEGILTHTIGGIAVGEKIYVERFSDRNGNGQIDAGEPAVRSFYVTDGAQSKIGGVRNKNVPSDEDGLANGAIDLRLDFAGVSPILNRQPGKYVIRVTAASGQATAPFEITAPNLPQRVTGSVRNSANNTSIPFANIIILVGDGSPIGSVRSDASGNYTFIAPAGSYGLVPFASGFFGGFNTVALAANQTVIQNLLLTPGTISVSGKVRDASSSAGLPSIFVLGQSDSGNLTGGLSDSGGNYSFSITSGNWTIHPLAEFVGELGYVGPGSDQPIDNSGSGPITIDIPISAATALIYGKVTDPSNNNAPIVGLPMKAGGQAGDFETKGRTSTTGDYFIGVSAGDWSVQAENPGAFGFRNEQHQVTMTTGQTLVSNFSLGRVTAHFSGKVVDAHGVGIDSVHFQGQIGDNPDAASSDTAPDGSFDLGVWGGNWTFHLGNARERKLIDHFVDLTFVDGFDQTLTYVVPDPTSHINGMIKDPSGQGVPNIEIEADTIINGVSYRTADQTAADGTFSMPSINGTWNISYNCQQIQAMGFDCPFGQQLIVNNNNLFFNVTLAAHVPAEPQIENPSLLTEGRPAPVFHFILRGDPGTYDILGSVAIPFIWSNVNSATIPTGGDTVLVEFNPGANHFFQAKLR